LFTVGRLSRELRFEHGESDPVLYRALAERGFRVRIMGGTCLAEEIGEVPLVELLPESAEDPAEFLSSLDCLFYRTSMEYFDQFGRLVFEAMTSGLPVVCAPRGRHAEVLTHGQDALFVNSDEEALGVLEKLRGDPTICTEFGNAARRWAQQAYGPKGLWEVTQYYLAD
jgi:glycosyltransferase involved in cell wall biosynthesis